MMQLRKIPLGPFIEILQELFETGADFIDISGQNDDNGETPKDTIKITVRPEYLSDDDDDNTSLELQQEINMDYSDLDNEVDEPKELSDDDIDALIQ